MVMVEVNLVVKAQEADDVVNDVPLLMEDGCHVMVMDDIRNGLIMTGFLKLYDDKLNEDDLVDEIVHRVECPDVLTADVNEVAREDVVVVDVNLNTVVKDDVAVFLNDDVELLLDVGILKDVVRNGIDCTDDENIQDDVERDVG